MPCCATSYLLVATQRSGSTLLVESLRASGCAGEPQEFFQCLPDTGMAPQPREWFAGVDDESIVRLLDPRYPLDVWGYLSDLRLPPTSATTNTRRNGKIVVPSARRG